MENIDRSLSFTDLLETVLQLLQQTPALGDETRFLNSKAKIVLDADDDFSALH